MSEFDLTSEHNETPADFYAPVNGLDETEEHCSADCPPQSKGE